MSSSNAASSPKAASGVSQQHTIWIAEDDSSIRFVLEKSLSKAGYHVQSYSNTQDFKAALREHPDALPRVVLSDIRMPGGSGLELLSTLHDDYPVIPVIIMTAFSDMENAVTALSKGAFEYITKPFDLNQVTTLVQRAIDSYAHHHTQDNDVQHGSIVPAGSQMLGQSPAMQTVFRTIGKLAHTKATVLIRGETGTGKELVARAIHQHSPHRDGPFVAINTAAIPKDLLESELFGHEKGAFTGANAARIGRFEQARGGTLFLDEIGDMPIDLQTRLLRVLSEGAFYRVGGMKSIPVETRIVAATHQNLEGKVHDGSFRQDLLHRLHVIAIELPPLRERKQDIPLLVQNFLQHAAQQTHTPCKSIAPEALEALNRYDYPGNVRELENICQSLNVMVAGQYIQCEDLPDTIQNSESSEPLASQMTNQEPASSISEVTQSAAETTSPSLAPPLGNRADWSNLVYTAICDSLAQQESDVDTQEGKGKGIWAHYSQQLETALIKAALQATGGKKALAAERLQIGRNTLTRKLQEYDIK